MRDYRIIETDTARKRANGSVAFFKGTVEVNGDAVPIKVQTQATDAGAADARINGDVLTLPDTIADKALARIAAQAAQAAHLQAMQDRSDQEKMGFILSRLSPVDAVSEKQASYATEVRHAKLRAMVQRLGAPADFEGEMATQREAIYAEVIEETSARFWLDTLDVTRAFFARAEAKWLAARQ